MCVCLTLCNPTEYSPSHSSVHGIFQARILRWIAISSSRGSSRHRYRTHVSCIGKQILYRWAKNKNLHANFNCAGVHVPNSHIVQESAEYYISVDKLYHTLKYIHLTIADFLCLSRSLFLFKLLKSDTLMILFFFNIIF